MARPKKKGVDYFPLDVDFFENQKIIALSREFGIKGEIVAIKLLCEIYHNGYFVAWNELLKTKLLAKLSVINAELLDRIVGRLVKWNFFDKDLFNSAGILTSIGIQERFFEITKRRKSPLPTEFLLINVDNNGVNVCNNPVNVYNNTQSKGKETKVKESKAKNVFSLSRENRENYMCEILLEDCRQELRSSQAWLEMLCMNVRRQYPTFTPTDLYTYLEDFFEKLQNEGVGQKSPADAMSHFARWLQLTLKNRNNENRTFPKGDWYAREETDRQSDIQPDTEPPADYSARF